MQPPSSNGLDLCELMSARHGRPTRLCRALISSHSSKPFELGGCIRHPASTGRHRRSILPQKEVRLSLQEMSQPASPDHPEHSCLSRGHCSHIYARHQSALHRWRASPASLAAGAHHRWLVLEMVDARGCQPVEAGLGIGPDG